MTIFLQRLRKGKTNKMAEAISVVSRNRVSSPGATETRMKMDDVSRTQKQEEVTLRKETAQESGQTEVTIMKRDKAREDGAVDEDHTI